jgi:TldD protein
MTNAIQLAETQLLEPGGLGQNDLHAVLSNLMGPAVDSGDLYFQTQAHESWTLEDGLVRTGNFSIEQGVGIRAVSGEKSGFAYADEIVLPSLMQASGAARAIASGGSQGQVQAWSRKDPTPLYLSGNPMDDFSAADKVDLLRRIDAYTRSIDTRVSQVVVTLAATHETILVASTDGTLAADVRPLVRLSVSVIAEQNGLREQGSDGGGGRIGYAELLRGDTWQRMADEAARQALINLEAEDAPAGTMTVTRGSGARSRGRLQSKRNIRIRGPDRRKSGGRRRDGRGRRYDSSSPRFFDHRR